jgi:hypothetical protein
MGVFFCFFFLTICQVNNLSKELMNDARWSEEPIWWTKRCAESKSKVFHFTGTSLTTMYLLGADFLSAANLYVSQYP